MRNRWPGSILLSQPPKMKQECTILYGRIYPFESRGFRIDWCARTAMAQLVAPTKELPLFGSSSFWTSEQLRLDLIPSWHVSLILVPFPSGEQNTRHIIGHVLTSLRHSASFNLHHGLAGFSSNLSTCCQPWRRKRKVRFLVFQERFVQ